MLQKNNTTENIPLQRLMIGEIKEKGYMINTQRIALINALCTLKTIIDPVELWIYLREQDVKISIGAVYHNLRMMTKEHLLIKVSNSGKPHVYTLNISKKQIETR